MLGPEWLYHPLGQCAGTHAEVIRCKSYNFVSGLGSDISEITLITMLGGSLGAWWHHHNCVEKGCWRKGHPDPEHGHPVCKKHALVRNQALKDHVG